MNTVQVSEVLLTEKDRLIGWRIFLWLNRSCVIMDFERCLSAELQFFCRE